MSRRGTYSVRVVRDIIGGSSEDWLVDNFYLGDIKNMDNLLFWCRTLNILQIYTFVIFHGQLHRCKLYIYIYIYEYEVMLLLMFSQGKSYGKKKIDSISFYQIIII